MTNRVSFAEKQKRRVQRRALIMVSPKTALTDNFAMGAGLSRSPFHLPDLV